MKKIFKIFTLVILGGSLVSCDGFLDRDSLTTMDDNNYWSSEGNLRLFVNGSYGTYFSGYSTKWGQVYAPGVYSSGEFSDDRTTVGKQANILLSVPADNWYKREDAHTGFWLARRGANAWNYANIRKWNLMIDRVAMMKEKGTLNEEQANHWTGVARFLRGWEYSRFVGSFGDVPYIDKNLTPSDSLEYFGPRVARNIVMKHVMEDFDYALANVRLNDGVDFIDRYVVATIASRYMLFEGTWYVYHKNDDAMKTCGSGFDADAKQFLQKAKEYSEFVIKSGKFKFDTDFRTLFGTLYARPKSGEILLYRAYNKTIYNDAQHCIASYSNGDEGQTCSGNLSTLKAWICQDGKPYANSTVANIDSWRLQDMVVNRDPRFESTFWDEPKSSATGLYTEKFIDRTGVTFAYNGQDRPTCYASCTNENGFPCVRYAETVLNWIEAKAELAAHFGGEAVTQADLDASINAIRKRPLDKVAIDKGVKKTAPLLLADINDTFDPERTSDIQKTTLGYKTTGFVTPLLWEIRRERRMEFFMEQYRVLDIRRWGQLELMLGANNPDLLVGGFVELDLAATLTAEQAAEQGRTAQTTNLKKTKNNLGYNILLKANIDKTKVRHILGKNPDGTLILSDPIAFDGTNFSAMRGFLVPTNIQDRSPENVLVRNYLEPICTQVLSQYKEKKHEIYQNAGWE